MSCSAPDNTGDSRKLPTATAGTQPLCCSRCVHDEQLLRSQHYRPPFGWGRCMNPTLLGPLRLEALLRQDSKSLSYGTHLHHQV